MVRNLFRCIVLAPWLAGGFVVSAGDEADGRQFELPKNPETTVIAFDLQGGFGPPRKNDDPVMSILADGTVKLPDTHGLRKKNIQGKITPAQLQQLLKFIVTDSKFFDYSPVEVGKEMAEADKPQPGPNGRVVVRARPAIADAPTTVISVTLADRSQELSVYALPMVAKQYKGVKPLQRLAAVQERLSRVRQIITFGGYEKLATILAGINARLKKQFPDEKPFELSDFDGGTRTSDGRQTATFRRTRDAQGEKPKVVHASVHIEAGGEPRITFSTDKKSR